MLHPMTVPAEIVDHILSFLQSDIKALEACSKSHPLLSQSAERHLYSHIFLSISRISSSDQNFSPYDLHKLLSKRPYIAHYIRYLEIRPRAIDLEDISHILPKLLALRKITLDHTLGGLRRLWDYYPESFRSAFLACLRLPSMQHVSLKNVDSFPFGHLLNDEYTSLRGLTLHEVSLQSISLVPDGSESHPNRRLPFEYLCLKDLSGEAVKSATSLASAGVLHLRSLKIWLYEPWLLPNLLASCPDTLTNLYLDIPLCISLYYIFEMDPPIIQEPSADIPIIWSTLPYLKELTIHSKLHYSMDQFQWIFYSAIPKITKLFSAKHAPSLNFKHLTLDFDCVCHPNFITPEFPPSASVHDVVCIPLVRLLSTISAFTSRSISSPESPSIHIEIFLNGTALAGKSMISARGDNMLHQLLLSSLRDCERLMHYLH